MNQIPTLLVFVVLTSQTNSAPQFISFQDGKLGINFGGYHAGVGIGGLLGGGNGAGGLYAEAGTPSGQAARAGLGGVVSESGGTSGGLYAGATAGGGVKAHTGLAGGVTAVKSAGGAFASAQAGPHYAASGLGGETSVEGMSGVTFSSSKDVIKPVHSHKTFYTEYNAEAANEVNSLPKVDILKEVHVRKNVQPVIVEEVSNIQSAGKDYIQKISLLHDFYNFFNSLLSVKITANSRQRLRRKPHHIFDYTLPQVPLKTKIVEKEIIHTHYKPRRHHLRKTAFLGGYVGGQGNIVAPTPHSIVYKTEEPLIQKRIDIGAEATGHVDTGAAIQGNGGIGGGYHHTKEVSIQKSPTFFADIFNIPISALKAVGDFLGNTAANTNISVQKTASVQAESDEKSLKHDPLSSSSSSLSSASHVSVETPSASKIIGDIFAIPINTLGAVNKFLENNAATRKNVQVFEDGTIEKRTRFGPHARRRANKHVVIVQEPTLTQTKTE